MATEWKTLDLRSIAKDAAKKTDDKLAAQISSLTRLTDEEVKKLFPSQADVLAFAELMTIVKSADAKNKKIKQITENAEKFSGIVLSLLGKLV